MLTQAQVLENTRRKRQQRLPNDRWSYYRLRPCVTPRAHVNDGRYDDSRLAADNYRLDVFLAGNVPLKAWNSELQMLVPSSYEYEMALAISTFDRAVAGGMICC